jgi:hypothetical protein
VVVVVVVVVVLMVHQNLQCMKFTKAPIERTLKKMQKKNSNNISAGMPQMQRD